MTTVLDILGTSTPVSEHVAEELGLVKAALVCRIFFYQQLKDGVCSASTKTLATKLGLSCGAVSTNLKWLLENDWICNVKPLVKGNSTNHYKVTDKFYEFVSRSGDERQDISRSGDERHVQEMNVDVHEVNVHVHEVNGKEEIEEEIKENIKGKDKIFPSFKNLLSELIQPKAASQKLCNSIELVEATTERLIISSTKRYIEILTARHQNNINRVAAQLGIEILLQERI